MHKLYGLEVISSKCILCVVLIVLILMTQNGMNEEEELRKGAENECTQTLLKWWISSTQTTHYLLLIDVPWAVGGGQGGGAGLAVPGDVAILGGAADG